MSEVKAKDLWGIVLFRGIASVLFGIAAVFWPGMTTLTLIYLFSAYILVNGIVSLVFSLVSGHESWTSRLLVMLISLVEIGVGVYLLRHPSVTFATLILLIGFTLIVRGVFDVVGGLFSSSKNTATSKLLTIVTGVLAGLAGLIVLFQPVASGVAFVWILGLFALISGPILIAMSLDLKNS